MEKILVKLRVPVIQNSYDLLVNPDMNIGELTKVLAKSVDDLSGGKYVPSGMEMLNQITPDILLDSGKSLRIYGIRDGDELALI